MIKKYIIFLVFILIESSILSQSNPFVTLPEQLDDNSFAEWITMPSISGKEYGVYYFRKEFELNKIPPQFIINISADNRYKLFVNEIMVSFGPAVGDLKNWNYEKIDILKYLKEGSNIIAAQIWNWEDGRGPRQISSKTAFILQGETKFENILNTNKSWKVESEKAYTPVENTAETVRQGYIAGVSERIDAQILLWKWNKFDCDCSTWKVPEIIGKGVAQGLNTWKWNTPWILNERQIPLMEMKKESIPKLCYVKGEKIDPQTYNGTLNLKVKPNSKVKILLDNKILTMGYPTLKVSKGNKTKISIQYQEALFDSLGNKGNRNEWKNKTLKGVKDIYILDGGDGRVFEPLWIRVFRYIKLEIETLDEELTINDFYNVFTAYPLEEKASFISKDNSLQKIWEASWRTARLCALETYMDCPYYEQLQYIGDTRIQALISYYISNDSRLAKNAIKQFFNSLQPMGLTKSAHPTSGIQIIPPFSLLFISMVYDYFMYVDDMEFVKKLLPGIRFILSWFTSKINENNLLGPLPYWNHIDGGTPNYIAGSPPGIEQGNSAHMSLLLVYTLQRAAKIFQHFEYTHDSKLYYNFSKKIKMAVRKYCFDINKRLIAETPNKVLFSQHTNSFAILTELFKNDEASAVAEKIISDKSLVQASLYFNFYTFQSLKKAGLGGQVLAQMNEWKKFLDCGLTTFPEHGIESRSDCHAWSAHPIFDLINITCGIESIGAGFQDVLISPNPGNLKYFHGEMEHPKGRIKVIYNSENSRVGTFKISIPEGLEVSFKFNKIIKFLSSGTNEITFNNN